MPNQSLLKFLIFSAAVFISAPVTSQVKQVKEDTFFLAKQKGLLGKLGKSMVTSIQDEPVMIASSFLKYAGRTIRAIDVFPLGFHQKIDGYAVDVKEKFTTRIGISLHSISKASVIRKNLFFKEGERFLPLLVSDNEWFLRDQNFLQDARIFVFDVSDDSVDIVVLTRDVFSIGGNININTKSARSEIREENVVGSGNEFSISGIYDRERSPGWGMGAELKLRNIMGSFLNWSSGVSTFNNSFSSNRYEENSYFTRVEKPLLNRYTQWIGSAEISYHKTRNGYHSDSFYHSFLKYEYSNLDVWGGYNIGYRSAKGKDSEKRLRHFVAGRTFYTYFDKLPVKYDSSYNSNFANLNGVLFSYSLYKQNFYRANFIYGFGRNEDVPIGLSAGLIVGWTNKQNQRRTYYGIEFEGTRFSSKRIFSSYKVRAGGYLTKGKLQDINLLVSIDHFTRLRRLNTQWLSRNFISFSYTRQLNSLLNEPLFLRSSFGLSYFPNGEIRADERATFKVESVFYNLTRILGFRFAPFVFGDLSLLRPINQPITQSDGYYAVGAGIRTRNESLVFGTIELRGYYFPRTMEGMRNWKIDITTKLRFRFNSNFIKKPDFIRAN